MTTTTWTLNVTTGLGGFVSRNLRDVLPAGALSVTSVAFNVTCLADGSTDPVCRVNVAGAGSEAGPLESGVHPSGSWSFSGVGAQESGAQAWMGISDFDPFTVPGFVVADGAETATWSYALELADGVDLWAGIVAVDSGEAGDSNYQLNSVTVTYTEGEPPPPPPLPVQVDVYEADNDTLVCSLTHNETTPADARQVRSLRGRVSLDDVGDGELTVDFDHPQVSELTGGRFVRVVEGDRTPLAFRIDRDRNVRIPPPGSGVADKTVTVRGAGPLDYMRLGRVLPWLAVGAKPVSRRRRFDWSSPQLDTTDWTEPFDQFRLTSEPGKPFGLPALFTTKWLWGEEEDDTMTIGECCFRRVFEITGTDPVQVSAFASADDGFEDAWQCVQVVEANEAFPGKVWHRPYRSPVLLEPGEYVYAAKARNDGGKGAFICDAWSVGAGGSDRSSVHVRCPRRQRVRRLVRRLALLHGPGRRMVHTR
jgi:hypothetical protein